MNKEQSRRKFLKEFIYFGTGLSSVGILLLSACNRKKKKAEDACEDFSGVSQQDLDKRKKLGYVKDSPFPDRHCGNCNLHIPPTSGKSCGGCLLFKGPVYSTGYCSYWAPQT